MFSRDIDIYEFFIYKKSNEKKNNYENYIDLELLYNKLNIYGIMSSLLKKLPTKERLNQVKKLSAEIFGANWNPECTRNGAKILRAPLKGPELVTYYGVNETAPSFKDFKTWFPELRLVDPKEAYRLKMVEDRKKRNKGAPKKKTK